MKTRYLLYPIIVILVFAQCQKENIGSADQTKTLDGKIGIEYMEFIRDMVKNTAGFSPPVASRVFGYAGLTLYESVVNGISDRQSLVGQVNELNDLPKPSVTLHWGQVANAAMNRVIELYFPAVPEALKPQLALIGARYKTEYLNETTESILNASTQYGIVLANAIFEYSKKDGGHNGYMSNFPSFTLPVGPFFWVPTSLNNLTPLQPYWGNNRPFAKNAIVKSQPIKHPEFSTDKTSLFYSRALEVYSITKNLTSAQLEIAKYWSDDPGNPGTPPGHSISITSQVLTKEKSNLATTAESYAKVGMAISDAFISCWKCKYEFNLLRPVTYINQQIDSTWRPLLNTPPFPEYSSGHSVQTAAFARVLSDIFGYGYSFTDNTHAARTDINGTARSYRSFDEAAAEAGISRLYGGIHFRDAIDQGIIQGYKVGDEIMALKFNK
ncbi:MAG: vanadium-dependent haloperoxidase [Saprospiraceae bacterium]